MLKVIVVRGRFHPFRPAVPGEIPGVDRLVSRGGMAETGDLVGGEGGVAYALDFVVEFSVHS